MKYNAAWRNNILILSRADGATLLETQKVNGRWQSKPDNLTPQDVKFFQGLKPEDCRRIGRKRSYARRVQAGVRVVTESGSR